MTIPQIQAGANQIATQGMDFARWAAGQGLDLANLVRGDRNAQLAVQNAFQQQQADRALAQQEFQNRLQKQREAQALAEAQQQAYQTRIANNLALGGRVQAATAPYQMPKAPPISRWDPTTGYYADQGALAQYFQNLLSKGYGVQSGVFGKGVENEPKQPKYAVDSAGFPYSPI